MNFFKLLSLHNLTYCQINCWHDTQTWEIDFFSAWMKAKTFSHWCTGEEHVCVGVCVCVSSFWRQHTHLRRPALSFIDVWSERLSHLHHLVDITPGFSVETQRMEGNMQAWSWGESVLNSWTAMFLPDARHFKAQLYFLCQSNIWKAEFLTLWNKSFISV